MAEEYDVAAAITEALEESGLTLNQLAERSGIPTTTMYRIAKEGNGAKFWQIVKIADALEMPIARFAARAMDRMSEDSAAFSPVVPIPVIDQEVSASLRGGVVVEHVYLPADVVNDRQRRSTLALKVRGDCLAPAILDGDTVIVDTDMSPESGNPVVATVDGMLHVKRLKIRQNGRWALQSNEGEMDIQPFQIEGVVVGLYRGMGGRLKL